MRSDRERLLDMQEAIERIEKYAVQGQDAFEQNELIQTWIVHHLQIIGEAARSLTDQIRNANQQVPWNQIIGMRNILVHHYFGIDVPIVWSVVETHLQSLKCYVQHVIDSLPEHGES